MQTMSNTKKRPQRSLGAFFILLISLSGLANSAQAADALNGKSLYLNGPISGGLSCANCHTATPSDNVSNVLAGANNPTRIANAIAQNRGGMGALKNKFSTAELADIAAFLGNPTVTATPAVTLAPANLSFDATMVGQSSSALNTTLTNTGTAALQLSAISLSSAEFKLNGGSCNSSSSLAAGASCSLAISFQPNSAGTRTGTLNITHNATGGSSQIGLTGTASALPQASIKVSASNLDFGNVVSNVSTPAQIITVTNAGQAPLSFSALSITGAQASAFQLGGSCTTQTALAVNSECTLSVQALLAQSGGASANLQMLSNASNGNILIALSATATAPVAALSASTPQIAFGAVSVGSADNTQTLSLKNSGNVAVTFSSVQTLGSALLSLGSANTCKGTLEVGKLCTLQVILTPSSVGTISGSLNIASNANSAPIAITATVVSNAVAKPILSDQTSLQFAATQVGTRSLAHISTLSNQGNATFKINALQLLGSHASDFVLGGTCATNASIAPNAQCTIEISFQATAAGARTANFNITTDSGTQINLALQGTGVAVPSTTPLLSLLPASFDFASQLIGGSDASQRIRLKNDSNVSIAFVTPQITGPYVIGKDAASCPAFPFNLAPTSTCELIVQFHPTTVGAAAGNIKLLTANSQVNWTITLNGVGRAAPGTTAPSTPTATNNRGGGGCSAAQDGSDPMLAILAILATAIVIRRHRRTSVHK